MSEHVFYHADRHALLSEGMTLELNDRGLSRFGDCYWQAISQKPLGEMSKAEFREYMAEKVYREPVFHNYASRLQCCFGALSVSDAKRYAAEITPKPDHPVPIYEIYATRFWTLDMAWLDYETDAETFENYCRRYWYAEISNHSPKSGPRRSPQLEVLIALPARVGKIVSEV